MATSKKIKKQVKPVFNPQKSYTWKTDDVFPITGAQVDVLNKVFSLLAQDPDIQKAKAILDGGSIVTSIIAEGFEEGIIIETPIETKSPAQENTEE